MQRWGSGETYLYFESVNTEAKVEKFPYLGSYPVGCLIGILDTVIYFGTLFCQKNTS